MNITFKDKCLYTLLFLLSLVIFFIWGAFIKYDLIDWEAIIICSILILLIISPIVLPIIYNVKRKQKHIPQLVKINFIFFIIAIVSIWNAWCTDPIERNYQIAKLFEQYFSYSIFIFAPISAILLVFILYFKYIKKNIHPKVLNILLILFSLSIGMIMISINIFYPYNAFKLCLISCIIFGFIAYFFKNFIVHLFFIGTLIPLFCIEANPAYYVMLPLILLFISNIPYIRKYPKFSITYKVCAACIILPSLSLVVVSSLKYLEKFKLDTSHLYYSVIPLILILLSLLSYYLNRKNLSDTLKKEIYLSIAVSICILFFVISGCNIVTFLLSVISWALIAAFGTYLMDLYNNTYLHSFIITLILISLLTGFIGSFMHLGLYF